MLLFILYCTKSRWWHKESYRDNSQSQKDHISFQLEVVWLPLLTHEPKDVMAKCWKFQEIFANIWTSFSHGENKFFCFRLWIMCWEQRSICLLVVHFYLYHQILELFGMYTLIFVLSGFFLTFSVLIWTSNVLPTTY